MFHRGHVALRNCVEDIANKEVRCWVPVREEGGSIFELGDGISHDGDTSSFHTPSQADSSFHTLERPNSTSHTPAAIFDGLHTDHFENAKQFKCLATAIHSVTLFLTEVFNTRKSLVDNCCFKFKITDPARRGVLSGIQEIEHYRTDIAQIHILNRFPSTRAFIPTPYLPKSVPMALRPTFWQSFKTKIATNAASTFHPLTFAKGRGIKLSPHETSLSASNLPGANPTMITSQTNMPSTLIHPSTAMLLFLLLMVPCGGADLAQDKSDAGSTLILLISGFGSDASEDQLTDRALRGTAWDVHA